jgi:hypothetical protein
MLDQDVKSIPPAEAGPVEFTSDDEKQATVISTDATDEIDREVEKRLLRKFDLRILPLLTFMYLCSWVYPTAWDQPHFANDWIPAPWICLILEMPNLTVCMSDNFEEITDSLSDIDIDLGMKGDQVGGGWSLARTPELSN